MARFDVSWVAGRGGCLLAWGGDEVEIAAEAGLEVVGAGVGGVDSVADDARGEKNVLVALDAAGVDRAVAGDNGG